MSKLKSPVTLNESILEEASGWFIDFNEGELDAAGREQFHQWLRRSPEHVRAYIEIAAAWEDSSRLNPPRTLDIDALIAQASAEHNIIPLSLSSASRRVPVPKVTNSTRRMKFAVAAAVLFALAGVSTWFFAQRNTYATATGEQRSITLTDGSTVVLNSRSRFTVRFTDSERTVELLDGQALFQVKKDPARPFVVDSNGTRVRVLGTQFDVYRKPNGTTITVIEGRVAVFPEKSQLQGSSAIPSNTREQSAAALSTLLVAGEQLTVAPRIASHPIRANLAAATAWTERKLIFDEASLAEVVTEFNRYNSRQLVIQNPKLAEFHIRGSFEATDPDRLVQFLRERFGVRVSERAGEIQIFSN